MLLSQEEELLSVQRRRLRFRNPIGSHGREFPEIRDGSGKDLEGSVDIGFGVEAAEAEADGTAGELVFAADGADDG